MNFSKVVAALAVNLLAAIPLAFADSESPALQPQRFQMPNDAEQVAMYCSAVLKLKRSVYATRVEPSDDPDIKKLQEEMAADLKTVIAKLDDDLNRIDSFLVPRVPHLDPDPMLTAYQRGEVDFATQQRSPKVKQCIDRCGSVEKQQRSSCMKGCMEEDDVNRRLDRCIDLSFLPY